ncbi:hypothetical protein TIFTF001_018590 [Ficus carica]|uniref:Uncharacterized protein n=1 Tax=Ficus carica TaxID=3494 RepID=A0AA88ABQ0_FICCA|nr:hypothetical protein TIFTF001_018590 [Ficus carica]
MVRHPSRDRDSELESKLGQNVGQVRVKFQDEGSRSGFKTGIGVGLCYRGKGSRLKQACNLKVLGFESTFGVGFRRFIGEAHISQGRVGFQDRDWGRVSVLGSGSRSSFDADVRVGFWNGVQGRVLGWDDLGFQMGTEVLEAFLRVLVWRLSISVVLGSYLARVGSDFKTGIGIEFWYWGQGQGRVSMPMSELGFGTGFKVEFRDGMIWVSKRDPRLGFGTKAGVGF